MFRRGLIKRKGEKERREFRVSSRLFGSVAKNRGTDFNWNKFGPGRKKARRISCLSLSLPIESRPRRSLIDQQTMGRREKAVSE